MKLKYPSLDNVVPFLVILVSSSIIGMTFLNYAICNFRWPLSIHYQAAVQGVKKEAVSSKCDETTSQSVQTLMALLATIIALKADLRKKEESEE